MVRLWKLNIQSEKVIRQPYDIALHFPNFQTFSTAFCSSSWYLFAEIFCILQNSQKRKFLWEIRDNLMHEMFVSPQLFFMCLAKTNRRKMYRNLVDFWYTRGMFEWNGGVLIHFDIFLIWLNCKSDKNMLFLIE